MSFSIAIPSYKRALLLNKKTLKMLHDNNVDKNLINVFVIAEEYDEYKNTLNPDYYNELIIGKKTLIAQRNFIENYYEEGSNLLCLDDDIDLVDFSLSEDFKNSTFTEFVVGMFKKADEVGSYIWSVYPVYNKFFRESKEEWSTCLNLLIGAFYGIINRPNHLKYITEQKEDVLRGLQYFIHDGIILRNNKVGFKTKYYGNDGGGMGNLKDRIEPSKVAAEWLAENYSEYGKLKIRKNGIHEFELKKIKARPKTEKITPEIKVLEKVDKKEFQPLLELLVNHKISFKDGKNGRLGFGKHRAETYGMTRQRYSGKFEMSRSSKKWPKIHEEIMRIGKLICPFEFETAYINNNVVCPKHKDANNTTESLLISFGDYTGCNIVIEGVTYDAKHTPLIFDGSKLEHYNTDDLSGNKYSIVYFSRNMS
jgi:hypothetical protein